ncbi:hypothetical protein [Aquimarina algicola]|uniref:Uncharacterized protein n=1 Tax=Aquimarina algicola TaxID=2589995 RepID=A0A504J694_9FLAO|nr:hypothetical protein [Aquimarina algicola]TPN84052.1 hypothetical protein FHK87_19010 [Aquimarina algicola]
MRNIKNLTNRQVEVYKSITNLIVKTLLSLTIVGIMVTILVFLLQCDQSWEKTTALATLEAIFGFVIHQAFRHYFPSTKNQKNGEE